MGQQHRAAAYLLPDPTEGNLSTRTEGRLYPFGYFWEIWCGLSGKVLFWVALRLPYLLGTPATMRRQALARWGSGLPPAACQILRRVASALTESRRRLYPSRCGYLLGAAGKSLPQTKERAALRLPYPLGTPATMRGRL